MSFSKQKIQEVWEKAEYCDCGELDCNPKTHRLCAICHKKMYRSAYQGTSPSNSDHKKIWNIDHKNPINGGALNLFYYARGLSIDDISNLQATHVSCNEYKANHPYPIPVF